MVLDKMFYTMALNSYKGVFGSTHGRTYSRFLKGGRRDATSGVQRIAWGMGTFNEHTRATVALACAKNYDIHDLLYAVAVDQADEVWDRERHGAGSDGSGADLAGHTIWGVDKVTYKTPDYMLASAQDYHPARGLPTAHLAGHHGPRRGGVRDPPAHAQRGGIPPAQLLAWELYPAARRQWKDTLVAVHNIPEATGWLHPRLLSRVRL